MSSSCHKRAWIGWHLFIPDPYHTSKFREALAKKAKTDCFDALVVAQLLRTGEYVQSQVADEDIQTPRELVSTPFLLWFSQNLLIPPLKTHFLWHRRLF